MRSATPPQEAREWAIGEYNRASAQEERLAAELAELRAAKERARALLEALEAYRDGEPAGPEGQLEARERAALVLVAESPETGSDAAQRASVLEVMAGVPGRSAWRPDQVAESLGRADTAAVRLLMDRMEADGELSKSSSRRYRLLPEAPAM